MDETAEKSAPVQEAQRVDANAENSSGLFGNKRETGIIDTLISPEVSVEIKPEGSEEINRILNKASNLLKITETNNNGFNQEAESKEDRLSGLSETIGGVKNVEAQIQRLNKSREEGMMPENVDLSGVTGRVRKFAFNTFSSLRERRYSDASRQLEHNHEVGLLNLQDQLKRGVASVGQGIDVILDYTEDETTEAGADITWIATGGLGRTETIKSKVTTSDRLLKEKEKKAKELNMDASKLSEAEKILGRQISPDVGKKKDEIDNRLSELNKKLTGERVRRARGVSEALRNLIGSVWSDKAVMVEGGDSVRVQGFSEMSSHLRLGTQVSNLEKFVNTPTNEQISQLAKIRKTAVERIKKSSEPEAQKLDDQINETEEIMRKRNAEYVEKCRQVSESAVVHMSSEEGMKRILTSGELRSQVSQRESGESPLLASARGQKEELPSLSFFVDGNDDKHGELAIVMPYSEAVKDHTIFEKSYSFGGEGPDELHVHDANYDTEGSETNGATVEIENAKFACPEDQKEKWETFMTTSKENGGAGRTKEWVDDHLVTFRDSLDEVIEEVKEEAKRKPPGRLVPTKNKSVETGSRTRVTLFRYEQV